MPSPGRYNEQFRVFESQASAVCSKAPRKIKLDYASHTDPGPGQYDVRERPKTAIQPKINTTWRYREAGAGVVASRGSKSVRNTNSTPKEGAGVGAGQNSCQSADAREIEAGDLHINYSLVQRSEPRFAFPRSGSSQTYRRIPSEDFLGPAAYHVKYGVLGKPTSRSYSCRQ